MEMNEMMCS